MVRALDVLIHPSTEEFARGMGRFYAPMEQHYRADLPWKGMAAICEAERAAKELRLRGFKFKPDARAFFPNEPRFCPLGETLALRHVGTTGLGAGTPGAGGLKRKYNHPIPYLDDIAAHPAWPWQDEVLRVGGISKMASGVGGRCDG